MRSWLSRDLVWACPEGSNDDWYWMYATVVGGAEARVLTNDEMRDHCFGMAAPRFFPRWKARHVVRFNFSHGEAAGRPMPTLALEQPPAYSREIQSDGGDWHFPPTASSNAEWLCFSRRRDSAPGGLVGGL